MTADDGMTAGPCTHLEEAAQRCALGHTFPLDCGGCPSYDDSLEAFAESERTRCEVWTRVMGYHRPVSAFNAGKREEHRERRYFVGRPMDTKGVEQ